MAALVVMTTTASQEDAERIAEAVLAASLAACVQMVPIQSRYRWKGEIQREGEILLMLKTDAGTYDALERKIREIHPYETPEIIALTVEKGYEAYLRWVASETGMGE